jgi:hypothetical protein
MNRVTDANGLTVIRAASSSPLERLAGQVRAENVSSPDKKDQHRIAQTLVCVRDSISPISVVGGRGHRDVQNRQSWRAAA